MLMNYVKLRSNARNYFMVEYGHLLSYGRIFRVSNVYGRMRSKQLKVKLLA